jgi:prolyl-tRNA editing enzyme YbaK/EbsC (Cys-tRNA(Pro) deacylase)
VVDSCLSRKGEVLFQAGDHKEAVKISYKDFERLAAPRVAEVCRH